MSPVRLVGWITFSASFAALGKDRLEHVGRGVGEAGKVAVALVAEHLIQHEKRILNRRLVGRHLVFLPKLACHGPMETTIGSVQRR